MNSDYIGKWFVEGDEADILEIADTIILVDKSPTEYDFSVEDVWNRANELGFNDEYIKSALGNVFVNKYAIVEDGKIISIG